MFDHREGTQYRLTGRINGTPDTVWGTFDTRSAAVTAPPGDFADERLDVLGSDGWKPYDGDWALYAGYVGEEGETTVEIRVRTASERVLPAQPRYFDQIYFAGAAPGTPITVHRECSLRPLFLPGPGFGSSLSFTDVAQVEIRQIELLEALAHLFNLRFYSEEGRKVVWVEPEEEFLGAGPEADWSDRTDFSQPVEVEDLALELHEERTWCYREGDGAVRRADAETGETLGSWSVRIDSQAALVGPETRRNPLFAPSLCSAGHYLNAPSALILQVGDRDDAEQGQEVTPRIVRYAGMHPLPEGERWGYPSGEAAYPLAAFLFDGDSDGEPFTLGFEDRGEARGLHRYYDRQVRREATRERISLALRIDPDEFAALLAPGSGAPDIRSVFRIDTGRGIVRATLRSIGEYDPEAASVRCTFDRLCEE